MDILKEFPQSEKQFLAWFWEKYSQPPEIFEGAPFVHQCEAIWRFLGYPVNAPEDWTIKYTEEFTRNILYIYNCLIIKYPDGTPDLLRNLKEMSYQERKLKYAYLETPADILHSLNEAIIDLDKYQIKIKPLPSLSDAIIMLKKIILAPIVEDTFWEDLKIKNTRLHETPPF
jgi:hypothetical protein